MDFSEVGALVLEFGTVELGCLGGTPYGLGQKHRPSCPLGAGAASLLCHCSRLLTTTAVTNRKGVVEGWSSSPHGKMWPSATKCCAHPRGLCWSDVCHSFALSLLLMLREHK